MPNVIDFAGGFRVIAGQAHVIDFSAAGVLGEPPPPPPPVTVPLASLAPFPRPLFDWRAADLSVAAGTFARASSGPAVDSLGFTRTLLPDEPRFEAVDLDGDGDRESAV